MNSTRQSLRRWNTDLTPDEVAARLQHRAHFMWFDSAKVVPGASARSILVADPQDWIEGSLFSPTDRQWLKRALVAVEPVDGQDWGFPTTGLFGAIDFNGRFAFGLYDQVLIYEHETDRWWENGDLSQRLAEVPSTRLPSELPKYHSQLSQEAFVAMVQRAKEYIAAGDIYQVNLSREFLARRPADFSPFHYYQRLRHFSPAPQAAYLDLGGEQILSASPELFLEMSGRHIKTRPVKGTRPRFRDPEEDERSAYELITSAKEIAELVMITDLERNDLGQVCEFGSVHATELLKLERFAQVFHLVSTVEGRLWPDLDHIDALTAAFPGGSISGAPKKRALEIIRELEPHARRWYTGAIGWFGGNGESQFNITIRTAVVSESYVHFHTGAGIVADSLPEKEAEETMHKASSILGIT